MGCDITSFVEYRDRNTGDWTPIKMRVVRYDNDIDAGHDVYPVDIRNYELFGILAGVRVCCADPIVEPRGIPSDVSDYVRGKYEENEDVWHTPSWYSLYELKLAVKDKDRYDEEERGLIQGVINAIEFMRDAAWVFNDDIDVRMVFWFDN